MAKEKLTYDILEQRFKEQDRLIEERKMQKPQMIYGFDDEDEREFETDKTMDEILSIQQKRSS
jgi:hypothetical protein